MDWRFSTFLLSLLALLFGITWATSDVGLCSSEYIIGVLRDHTKDGALNCFDFWLNRYQTLISALIALAAALLALLPARGQLREMRRQSSASAWQSAKEQAVEIEAEIAAYKAAAPICRMMRYRLEEYDHESWSSIYQEWPDRWRALTDEIVLVRDKSLFNIGRHPVTNEVSFSRLKLSIAATNLSAGSIMLGSIFRRTIHPDYEFGEDVPTEEESAAARSDINKAIEEFENTLPSAIEALNKQRQDVWQQVRLLEQSAIGR